MTQKTLGIIGGIGPESTLEYYRLLIRKYRERDSSRYPQFILNSIDLSEMWGYVSNGQYDELTGLLVKEIGKLQAAGADFALIASNTPHIVFDRIRERSALPLISIVEEACRALQADGISKAVLLGTRFAMGGGYYQEAGRRYGLELIAPEASEQEEVHTVYVNELIPGIVRPESQQRLTEIVHGLAAKTGAQALVLGGTELPLLLSQAGFPGLKVFDTAVLHVESAVREMFK